MTETKTEEQNTKLQRATAMQLAGSGELVPANFAQMMDYANMIAESGMVPKNYVGNVGAVLVAIQMGAEVGLKPMAAIQNIAVINGRPSLWGDALLALIVSHPECEDVIEDDLADITKAGKATCIVNRRGRSPVTTTFSIDDAKTAGLWKKAGPWTQYPSRMLKMRARAFACRDAFPDALRGIQSAEESRDIQVIDATPEWIEPTGPVEGRAKVGGRKTKPAVESTPDKKPEPEAKAEPESTPPVEADSSVDDQQHGAETGEVAEPWLCSAPECEEQTVEGKNRCAYHEKAKVDF